MRSSPGAMAPSGMAPPIEAIRGGPQKTAVPSMAASAGRLVASKIQSSGADAERKRKSICIGLTSSGG